MTNLSEARKSHHNPSGNDEEDFLIYNHSPFYTGKDGYMFVMHSIVPNPIRVCEIVSSHLFLRFFFVFSFQQGR